MHQIYIAAIITTALTFIVMGGFLKWKSPPKERPLLITLLLLELPMAIAVFYLVRLPLVDGLVRLVVDKNSWAYGFISVFYAPITEEPAKLLPLLIPLLRRKIDDKNTIRAALALGLGFGLGEIWLVAGFVAASSAYTNIPWYQYSGFLNERFMVSIIHGVFTATALRRLHKGFIWGLLGAMCLHYFGNLPIYLAGIGFFGFSKETWQVILAVYTPIYFVLMLLLLSYYSYGKENLGKLLFGNSVCPECGFQYPAPIMALNSINKRYERCPNCKKWHWVKMWRKDYEH